MEKNVASCYPSSLEPLLVLFYCIISSSTIVLIPLIYYSFSVSLWNICYTSNFVFKLFLKKVFILILGANDTLQWVVVYGRYGKQSHGSGVNHIFFSFTVIFLIATLFKLGALPSLGWKWALSQWLFFLVNLNLLCCDLLVDVECLLCRLCSGNVLESGVLWSILCWFKPFL